MRYSFFLLLCLLPILGFSQDGWIPYRSPEGGFKVLTKGIFKTRLTHAKTGIGEITMHNLVYQTDETGADNHIFVITFYDFPEQSMHSDSTVLVNDFFKETIASAVSSTGGELAYQSEISLHGFKGLHWRINYAEGKGVIKTQAFLVNNRYYSLSVMMPDVAKNTVDANKFFNSFRLIGYGEN